MIISILLILLIFVIVLTLVWVWYFKNEKAFCSKLYALGLESFDSGNYQKAKGYFSRIVFVMQNYNDAEYRLGLSFLKLKEYENAQKCFENVLNSNPKDFDAIFNLGLSFQLQGKYEKAETAYNKALKENEKNLDAVFNLGLVLFLQKKYANALDSFNAALGISEDSTQILFYIARCNEELCSYDDESQGEQIIENYLKLIDKPDLPSDFNYAVAKAYAKTGNLSESEAFCRRALTDNTEDVESYKLLGIIKLIKKDFVETKNIFTTAINLQPNNRELHNILSYVLCYQVDNCPLNKCRAKYLELMKKFIT